MKKLLNLLLLILFCLPVWAQPSAPLPMHQSVRTGKLSNGLTYFILKNKRPEKRMELRLAVNTGSTNEDEDQQGLAHFVEHMAFNGTAHFKKNELVDYLESVGSEFGPHLNAYTSFDETVYMMQVPTDSAEIMNKAFLILEDWAGGLSFDHQEIDKERGVVVEEWRLGQGAYERMRNKYWPLVFKGSRYEVRLPIGKKEILETATYDKLKQYYKDWYRPELMAVIAIGDFDVDEVEQKIKSHFSKLQNPANPKPLQKWEVPDQPTLDIVQVTDKEAPYTMVEIMYRHPAEEFKSEADYRRSLMYELYNGMIGARLDELKNGSNPPFSYAYTYYGGMVRGKNNYASFGFTQDKDILRCVQTLVQENEKVRRFGFTASEFERQKKSMIRNLEKQLDEKDKTESARFTYGLVNHFLEQYAFFSVDQEKELQQKYLSTITLEEVNALAKKWITPNGKNCVVVVQAPEKPGMKLPTDAEIRAAFEKAEKQNLKAYVDEVNSAPLLAAIPKAGSVQSVVEKEKGIKEMLLSNGVKVVYKQTDFKNDEVLFTVRSYGGASLYPVADDMSSSYCTDIVDQSGVGTFNKSQLEKYMKDKIGYIYPYVSEVGEGMNGSSSAKDLETFLQLIHLYFTAPRNDVNGYKSFMEQQKTFIENGQLDPERVFDDTINTIMSNYHPRRRPWTMQLLKEIDHKRALAIYKERFANAADFTFFFVGSFDEENLKKWCATYLGSLPANDKKEKWVNVGIVTPKGKITKTVYKGVEPKSKVQMMFSGPAVYNQSENFKMLALTKLLDIKLRESLREEKSGTYGVSCWGYIKRIPEVEYGVTVMFDCAPDNVDMLTKAAYEVMDKVKSEGIEEKDLVKVKETFRREREVNLKENRWWLNTINTSYMMGDPLNTADSFETMLNQLNKEDFKQAATQYLNRDNHAYFVLMPEKK